MEAASQEISSTSEKTNVEKTDNVIQAWIIDYYFATLCRLFKERAHDEFRKTMKIFEVLVDGLDACPQRSDLPAQRTICCFLTRVMDGKNLGIRYDDRVEITPLMSALTIWDLLKSYTDSALHSKIQKLLTVQSVVVCVKSGNAKIAKETMKWLQEQNVVPENLQRMLATILKKKDSCDQPLLNLSFEELMEDIDTFLETFNQQSSSVFLIEAASKVVQGCQERSDESIETEKSDDTPSTTQSTKPKHKRKLLSQRRSGPWGANSIKKEEATLKRTNVYNILSTSSVPLKMETPTRSPTKARRKWTYEEDQRLKAGVRKFGVGHWKEILNEFDFGNRTGVNLKDRWRNLQNHRLHV
ncbi:hypothetical protein DNTS_003519 [Danionella cerebrum]|uniref:Telomeric repeat-binding factor n=1 Tax=Danionella cerebrum TaxID=2873325 RepID=A0A553MTT8_9TELE|nr:hypothetical protein DNTS_003519 [Danionella translucida]